MGLEKGEPKSSKVLIYPAGSSDFVLYEGESPLWSGSDRARALTPARFLPPPPRA